MISVFIPTYNEEDNIRKCIENLSQYPQINEIIVVDDQSIDKTVQIAESMGAIVIIKDHSTHPRGKSSSMNVAAEVASNDIMFVTDADAYVIDLEDAIEKAMINDVVGVPISIEQDGRLISELENHEYDIALKRIRPWMKRNFEKMFSVSGAGFFIKTKLVRENPIDADIMGEDLWYSCMAHVKGWSIEASESEVRTYAIPSAKALLIQRARWVRGYFQIIKRSGHHIPLVDSVPVIYRIIVTFLALITLSMGRVDVTFIVLLAYFLYEYARSGSIKRSIQMMVYRQVNFLAFLYAPFCPGWTVKRR